MSKLTLGRCDDPAEMIPRQSSGMSAKLYTHIHTEDVMKQW